MLHSRHGSQGVPLTGIGGRVPGGGGAPPGYSGGADFGMPPLGPPDQPQGGGFGGALRGIGGRIGSGIGDAVRWGTENPEIAGAVLGTGAEVWGAHKAGQQADKDREENIRRYEREQEREDERQRNRSDAYARILDRRKAY